MVTPSYFFGKMAATSEVKQNESKVKKRKERQSLDVSGESAWISAHHDPVASLYTFTSCLGELL